MTSENNTTLVECFQIHHYVMHLADSYWRILISGRVAVLNQ